MALLFEAENCFYPRRLKAATDASFFIVLISCRTAIARKTKRICLVSDEAGMVKSTPHGPLQGWLAIPLSYCGNQSLDFDWLVLFSFVVCFLMFVF